MRERVQIIISGVLSEDIVAGTASTKLYFSRSYDARFYCVTTSCIVTAYTCTSCIDLHVYSGKV